MYSAVTLCFHWIFLNAGKRTVLVRYAVANYSEVEKEVGKALNTTINQSAPTFEIDQHSTFPLRQLEKMKANTDNPLKNILAMHYMYMYLVDAPERESMLT